MRAMVLAGLATGLVLGLAAGFGAATWWRPAGGPMSAGSAATPPAAEAFGYETVKTSLERLAPARRQALLDDAQAFAAWVERRGAQHVLAAAAVAAGLPERPAVAAALRETTVDVLAAQYLAREAPVSAVTPPDEARVESFYREQEARFRVPDRLPVWQIFIAAASGDEAARADARGRARTALESLLAGKASLAEVAATTSEHPPSRQNGGFMGLLAPEELMPEVREALLTAPQGKPVGPIETAAGFHIVQRGALVPGSVQALDQVRPQIVAYLTEQALQARQDEVLRKAATAHPVTVDAADLEPWRTRLKDELAQEAAAAGAQK